MSFPLPFFFFLFFPFVVGVGAGAGEGKGEGTAGDAGTTIGRETGTAAFFALPAAMIQNQA